MAPRSLTGAMVIAALLAVTAYSQAQPGAEPAPVQTLPATVNPWRDLPGRLSLQGLVTDTAGKPIADVAIGTADGPLTTSDHQGRFVLPAPLAPDTPLAFRHPDHADLRRAAGFFHAGEGRDTRVELVPLALRFELTPAGGEFSAGGIRLSVPEGAVAEPVTVRAARLPLDLAYEDSPDIQLLRLGAVEFAPEGLRFAKPITVSVDLDQAGPSGTGRLLLQAPASGRFTPETASEVTIAGGRAVFQVDHFSRRTVGDPAEGMVRKHIARSNDINGDGKLTSEDADFVILLSGGTQSADFTITTEDSTTVSKATAQGTSSANSSSAGVGGGIEIGGSGIEVSHTVSREESSEVVKKAGLERTLASSTSTTDRLSAGEYQLRCKYYTGLYDFYRVEIWARHTPVDWEQKALEDAWAGRSNPGDEWGYFSWDRSTAIALNKSMYGLTHLALRMGPDGLEIYRLARAFVVKQRFATYPVDCKPGSMDKRVEKALQGATDPGTGAGNMRDNFRFFGGGDKASAYRGWGVLPETDALFKLGQECDNESEGEYIITSSLGESSGEEQAKSSSRSSQTEAKVSGGAGVGPVKISAEVSAATGTSSGRSEAESYARNVLSTATTRVHWHIINAHQTHYSDHMVAPLHNVKRVGGHDIKRPIGLMVLRYREYPCGETPPTTTTPPDDEAPPRGDDRQGGAAPPARTPHGGNPVITPSGDSAAAGPTSSLGDTAYVTPEPLKNIRVEFTQLKGETRINRALVGQPRGIEVIGIDPDKLGKEDVRAGASGETIYITVRRELGDAGILVRGDRGNVTITAVADGGDQTGERARERRAAPNAILPQGLLVSVGGLLEGTLGLPDSLLDVNADPGAYRVTLGDAPLQPVAIQGTDLAVVGTDIVAPASGSENLTVTAPSGASATNEVPLWYYRIDPQPVTRVNQWADIRMECSGLGDETPIAVRFQPTPSQTIEPATLTLRCGELASPREVARYRTTRVGTQPLNATVTPLP